MADNNTLHVEDVLPVKSRMSWGAVFAGAVIALAIYLALTLLATAVNLHIADNVRSHTLGLSAMLCAIFATLVALFVGGWVTSQLTVGENHQEAIIHGVVLWGVVFGALMWMGTAGLRSGFNAMVSMAYLGNNADGTVANPWEEAARRAGVPQDRIDEWKRSMARTDEAARDPEVQEANRRALARLTWLTLGGVVLSIAAAAAGALVGCGPTLRLVYTPRGPRLTVRQTAPQTTTV
jgi:hypothetical protein